MSPYRIFCIVLGLTFSANALADHDLWLGVKVGTLGLGVEATWRPIRWFDVRAGFNSFDYDDDGSRSGIDYDATLDLQSFYATANFRVPLSPFRFSAGLYNNGNELRLVSRDTSTFNIGGTEFSSADVGTLRGLTSFDSTAPYAGVGLDFGLLGKVGLSLDLGVLFQGDPRVTLTADGPVANDPAFQQALEDERADLEDDVDKYKVYPVASLTFSVRFL